MRRGQQRQPLHGRVLHLIGCASRLAASADDPDASYAVDLTAADTAASDTADTAPVEPAVTGTVTATGTVSVDCSDAQLDGSFSYALGNLAGNVTCGSLLLVFVNPKAGEWTDPFVGNDFRYDDGTTVLAWEEGMPSWRLAISSYARPDAATIAMAGEFSGEWADARTLAGSFDVRVPCAGNCP